MFELNKNMENDLKKICLKLFKNNNLIKLWDSNELDIEKNYEKFSNWINKKIITQISNIMRFENNINFKNNISIKVLQNASNKKWDISIISNEIKLDHQFSIDYEIVNYERKNKMFKENICNKYKPSFEKIENFKNFLKKK